MYHYIVKERLLNSFKALNEGRYELTTRQFHKTKATHWFSGENHPLSGLRTKIEDIYAWYLPKTDEIVYFLTFIYFFELQIFN